MKSALVASIMIRNAEDTKLSFKNLVLSFQKTLFEKDFSKNNNALPKVEKYFFVMRNRLYEAKSVFEGGNVALLNCFSMVSRRRFVNSGNGSGAVEVTTSGGWGCADQTREIAAKQNKH